MDELEQTQITLFIPTANEMFAVRDENDGLQIQAELMKTRNVYSWLIYRN